MRGPFPARGGAGRTFKVAVSGASLFAALALAAAGRAQAQQGSWQPAKAMPTPRRLLAAAALDGKAYALGGCGSACFEPPLQTSAFEETRVEVYDPSSDTWAVKNPMPTILFGAAAVAPGNGKIYTLGGVVSGNVVQEYEPASDSWTLRQPMPTPRYGLAAVALDGKIYAIGGNGPSNAVEVYDPATDTWSSRAPMTTARVFLAAAVAGGKIYAIGGSPDCCGNSQTDVVEVYDPAADRWDMAAPLPVALQVSAAAGIDGLIYTFGGFVPGSGLTGATFQYTPGLDAWTRQPDMPTPRDEAPAVVLGGDAFVLGGAVQCHCQALPYNERFTPVLLTPTADLAVDLTGGALGACAPVRLRIAVANHGPDPASGALVEDRFPPELSGIAWTCQASGGARCGATMGGGSDRIEERVDLPVGGSVVYEVSATLAASASGSLADTARVEPPAGVVDPQPGNDRSTFAAPIACAADLEVQSVAPPTLVAGATAPYVVTVTNHGPCCAAATVLVVTPQAGLDLVSPLPSGCAAGGGQLTCRLGTICPGQVKQVSARVEASCDEPVGPIASLAQATGATCDPVPANNSRSAVTQVEVVADYAIVKTVTCTPPVVTGDAIRATAGCAQAAVG
ncbi:MAG TPA: kelch repeat-containing protein, partial [Thermoanaerobaculia bacterium]|nr:kelch repeat-containing protein [Thermoanaerobaculia bacterium]